MFILVLMFAWNFGSGITAPTQTFATLSACEAAGQTYVQHVGNTHQHRDYICLGLNEQ